MSRDSGIQPSFAILMGSFALLCVAYMVLPASYVILGEAFEPLDDKFDQDEPELHPRGRTAEDRVDQVVEQVEQLLEENPCRNCIHSGFLEQRGTNF